MGNTPQPPPILLRNWLTTRPTEHCSKTADGKISAENRSLQWCLSSPLVLIENWPAFLRKRCHPPCQSGVLSVFFEACFSSSIDWLRVLESELNTVSKAPFTANLTCAANSSSSACAHSLLCSNGTSSVTKPMRSASTPSIFLARRIISSACWDTTTLGNLAEPPRAGTLAGPTSGRPIFAASLAAILK